MNKDIEKALLVGVNIDDRNFEISMSELRELVYACNFEVVGTVEQNLEKINSSFYVGTGKVQEIKKIANQKQADIIIFDNELSPSQLRNLQDMLDIPILDRTALILEIFASRAKTKEAKLQVEVARLKYMLPRIVGLHDSLGRQGGGSGLSNKGSGEKKLELDRRKIEDKLTELNKELEKLVITRETQRKQRKKSLTPIVSLVGYTNAGKSTLMNALIDIYKKDDEKKVFEKDMLFATLDTTIREIETENKKKFLISDTVGFISKLPHNLIKAFRSTLEEVKESNLLLHVIDYSDPNYKEHIDVTNETLNSIGAGEIPVIYVYNKSDLMLENLPVTNENSIYISAKNKQGIIELTDIITKYVYANNIDCKMRIPYEKGNILSYFNKNATIKNTTFDDIGTIIDVNCRYEDSKKYEEYMLR